MNHKEIRKKQLANLINQVNSICLSCLQLSFLGNISYTLKKVIIDLESIKMKNGCSTRGGFTDGESIYILCNERTVNRDFLLFMILHEVLHVVSKHCYRGDNNFNFEKQIAADHVVNSLLVELSRSDIKYIKPDYDYIIYFPDLHAKFPGISVEELQQLLIEQKRIELQEYTKFKIEDLSNTIDSNNQGSSDGESNDPDQVNSDADLNPVQSTDEINLTFEVDSEDELNDKCDNNDESANDSKLNSDNTNYEEINSNVSEHKTLEDCNNNEDVLRNELKKSCKSTVDEYVVAKYKDKITGELSEVVMDTSGPSYTEDEEKIKDLELRSSILWKSQRDMCKGSLPGKLVEYIDSILEVKLPWYTILSNAILYKNQHNSDSSWLRKNEIIRIGRCMGNYHGDSVNTMIISLDSSASVSTKDLKQYFSVIEQSIKKYTKVIVLIHDIEIQDIITFNGKKNLTSVLDKMSGVKGRGGTSHKYVFSKIDELCKKEKVSSIVFLTDFMSDVEKIYDNYDFTKRFDPIWVISNCKYVKNTTLEKPDDIKGEWININD